jgi:hypothetical protein
VTDQSPEAVSPPSSMPVSVRVAVIVMGVLAALLLTNAALLWYSYGDAVDRLVREGNGVSRSEAGQFVLVSLVPYLLLGLMLALAAWFLPRRHAWARWTGLAASALLAVISLLSAVGLGGVTIATLLVVVLSVAAVTSLLARTTGAWVPTLRTRA